MTKIFNTFLFLINFAFVFFAETTQTREGSETLPTIVGFVSVGVAFVANMLDISSTKEAMKYPGLREKNKKFIKPGTDQADIGKLMLYKFSLFAGLTAIALVLFFFFNAGYFAFFFTVGVTIVNLFAYLTNKSAIKKEKQKQLSRAADTGGSYSGGSF